MLKKLIFLFFFGFIISFSSIYIVQKREETKKDLANYNEKNFKNRDLILGDPQFIQKDKQNLSVLKNHVKNQWALKDISILKAWEIIEETKKNFPDTYNKPIVVAVIDTGIHKKHPCLKPNLWVNKKEIPDNGKDDDNNGFVDDVNGWNFVDNNNNIQDYHGHGTHISGIIAAKGRTTATPNCQIIGVAPHTTRIMTLKYFDEGENNNNIENTIKSIKYAVDNGADIINYSGGGPGENEDERSIIAKANDKGVIFVAALGNDGSKIGKKTRYYPASYELPNIIYLQSKNKENEIIESSNLIQTKFWENKKVQTAPGEDIISALPPKRYLQGQLLPNIFRTIANIKIQHNNYGYMTGTSQATAVTTGVVSLVKALYPFLSTERLINQVSKTGFGQGTDKIRKRTNQGKKLDAYEALIMRDNVDRFDHADNNNTNSQFPFTEPEKIDSALKNARKPRKTLDVYDPDRDKSNEQINQIQVLEDFKKIFTNKKQ